MEDFHQPNFGGNNPILDLEEMAALLCENREPAQDYCYIHPSLLWKGFNTRTRAVDVMNYERRKYAWGAIRDVLLR